MHYGMFEGLAAGLKHNSLWSELSDCFASYFQCLKDFVIDCIHEVIYIALLQMVYE